MTHSSANMTFETESEYGNPNSRPLLKDDLLRCIKSIHSILNQHQLRFQKLETALNENKRFQSELTSLRKDFQLLENTARVSFANSILNSQDSCSGSTIPAPDSYPIVSFESQIVERSFESNAHPSSSDLREQSSKSSVQNLQDTFSYTTTAAVPDYNSQNTMREPIEGSVLNSQDTLPKESFEKNTLNSQDNLATVTPEYDQKVPEEYDDKVNLYPSDNESNASYVSKSLAGQHIEGNCQDCSLVCESSGNDDMDSQGSSLFSLTADSNASRTSKSLVEQNYEKTVRNSRENRPQKARKRLSKKNSQGSQKVKNKAAAESNNSSTKNSGFSFIYLDMCEKVYIPAISKRFSMLGLQNSRIIDTYNPTHKVIAILVHNDYYPTAIEKLAEHEIEPIQSFDPTDEKNMHDPNHKGKPIEKRQVLAKNIHQNRLTNIAMRIGMFSVARDFREKQWITENQYRHLVDSM